MSTGLSAIAVKLTTLSSNARLSDLALFMTEGQVARAKKIRSVLGHLAHRSLPNRGWSIYPGCAFADVR